MKKMAKLILIALLWTIVCGLLATSYAEVPRLITYQGRLTDNADRPLNGTHDITFRLYDDLKAGTLLWTEKHPAVPINSGLFNIMLGSATLLNLDFDKPYYLSIQVDTDPEMYPRQQLASAGYALRAEEANGVRGAENIFPGSGNVGIGTPNPLAKLEVGGEGTIRLAPKSAVPTNPYEGTLFYNANDKRIYLYGGDKWRMLATAAISTSYPDEKTYTCSVGSGPCNLDTQVHFTWANITVPSIIKNLRVRYQWSSGNFAHGYYTHNVQVLVNGSPVESFMTYESDWVERDNVYDVSRYLRYDGNDTVRIQLTDTGTNEEDWYKLRNVYFEFQ